MLKMEKYENSTKESEAELWIENSKICDNELRKEIMTHLRMMLPQGDNFDVTNLLPSLPSYLASLVKEHLCFPILKKVRILQYKNLLRADVILVVLGCGSTLGPTFTNG